MRALVLAFIATLSTITVGHAFGVGEQRLLTTSLTAALRDYGHRADLRVTVWYPAPDDVPETRRLIGPPGHALFEGGSAGNDAPLASPAVRRPVILLSHGFGGSARMMSWFGTALARQGMIVAAVDHPGNTMADPMTVPGAALWWERADDLRAAWDAVRTAPPFAAQVDPNRLGVAGFSAGGFTALVAAGARVNLAHFDAFCGAHPDDGVCQPQGEMTSVSGKDRAAAFATDAMKAAEQQAGLDHAVPGVRAAFVMAPALIQALDPESLRSLAVPTRIVLGADDHVAPPSSNGDIAARLMPHAALSVMPGVGHYDFLSVCTQTGRAALPLCRAGRPQADTHRDAIEQATSFFNAAFAAQEHRAP